MPFITIPNTPDVKEVIKKMRVNAKWEGVSVVARGRCKNRKDAFAQTGRYYSVCRADSNDIYLGSKEAPFCYAWAIYLRKKKPLKGN